LNLSLPRSIESFSTQYALHAILEPMQPQHIDNEPPAASFAGLLSAMTAAKASPSNSFTDDLENDVATITGDRVLQDHAQYRTEPAACPPAPSAAAALTHERAQHSQSKHDRKRMSASVTIRMSQEEFAQLQQRSTEANLTVSAYLRSCTFEVESLRTQVKQALAELRNPPATPQPESASSRRLRLIRR